MKVIKYKITDSPDKNDIGRINNVVVLETSEDIYENENYVEQGCDNNTLAGERWAEYLYERTGLCDEDVFLFMKTGDEDDTLVIDGVTMQIDKQMDAAQ